MSDMTSIRLMALLLALLTVANANDVPEDSHNSCSTRLVSRWPSDLRDDQLTWRTNDNEQWSGPLYALQSNLKNVEPRTQYKMNLTALVAEKPIKRFLIWTDSDEKCASGILRSLSDKSEHLSYNCLRYLVEREAGVGLDYVEFSWESPMCGCSEISVSVLGPNNELYTIDEDPHEAMSVLACVQDELSEKFSDSELIKDESNGNSSKSKLELDELASEAELEQVLRRVRRKALRRRGKAFCCKKGASIHSVDNEKFCDKVSEPVDVLKRAVSKFKVPRDKCHQLFHECCNQPQRLDHYRRQAKRSAEEQRLLENDYLDA